MTTARVVMAFIVLLFSTQVVAGKDVSYQADGDAMTGYLANSAGPSKGLVIILHDWDGLTDYEKKRADMISAMGYDAFAVDLYGTGKRPEVQEAKKAATQALYGDRPLMRKRIVAGLEAARRFSSSPAVMIGYCFGGSAALEWARKQKADPSVVGIVTFHGGLKTPDGQSYQSDTPPLFIAHGGADTSVSMSDVATLADELEAEKVNYEIEVYSGAPHAFTVFGSGRYDERADKKSWLSFKRFLTERLPG